MSYHRKKEDKRRLVKLHASTKNKYGAGAWYDKEKKRLIKASNTPGYTKFLRRLANKKVRKMKNVPNRMGYKKAYDYWWELF